MPSRDSIEYLGEVDHAKKVDLLQNARVTLFPIEWEEPLGLVMIESMAVRHARRSPRGLGRRCPR